MAVPQQIGLGLALVLGGWILVRAAAGADFRRAATLLLDAALPLTLFGILFAATASPISAGVVALATISVFGVADHAKRAVLLEPIVFADLHQTMDVVVRHPQMNLLVKCNRYIAGGGILVISVILAAFFLEPPLWTWSPWPVILAVSLAGFAVWCIGGPLLGPVSRILRRLRPVGDPVRDAATLGPFAMQLAHYVIARAERPARGAAVAPPELNRSIGGTRGKASPVVVVQCESFFDPRRLHPAIAADLLPIFDACRSNGVQWGQLLVPGTGANTVRTEFAVLTGLDENTIGFDRFNPYLAFARLPIRSLAWRMRAEGYRTICVHPFDPRFFRRDLVMKNLGFEVFLGEEAFAHSARAGLYVADVEVARLVADLIREEGPAVFVFAITMENHGPWPIVTGNDASNLTSGLPEFSDRSAFDGFLHGIKDADAMLEILTDVLRGSGDASLLAFYGDHLPAFPIAFAELGFHDQQTDYVIWRAGGASASRRDLTAHDLSQAIWNAWRSSVTSHAAAASRGNLHAAGASATRDRVGMNLDA
jgi:Sulfatase